jgi:predicted double-glycine peptidase
MRCVAAALLASVVAFGTATSFAQERRSTAPNSEGERITTASVPASVVTRPRTYLDMRYANMVRQALDFSCGAAALATIINDYWASRLARGRSSNF